MALVYVDGFDAGDWRSRYTLTDGEETGIGTVSTTRTGTGLAWRATTYSAGNTGLMRPIPSSTYVTVGVAIWADSPFSSAYDNRLLGIGNISGAQITVALRSNGVTNVYRGGTILFTIPAPVGAWYYLELKTNCHDTTGFTEARINGVVVGSFTGDTKDTGTLNTLDRIYIGSSTSGNGDQSDDKWDDLYVTAGATVEDAEYLGEVRIKTLAVNGPGTFTGLTPTGSSTNWQNVDELPPSNTDYNSSDVSGTRDTYATENLALAPGDRIIGVQANAVVSTVEAGTAAAKLIFRSGATEVVSSPTNVTSTTTTVSAIYPQNPATSGSWSEATVNDVEVGVEVG